MSSYSQRKAIPWSRLLIRKYAGDEEKGGKNKGGESEKHRHIVFPRRRSNEDGRGSSRVSTQLSQIESQHLGSDSFYGLLG